MNKRSNRESADTIQTRGSPGLASSGLFLHATVASGKDDCTELTDLVV